MPVMPPKSPRELLNEMAISTQKPQKLVLMVYKGSRKATHNRKKQKVSHKRGKRRKRKSRKPNRMATIDPKVFSLRNYKLR